MWSWMKSKVCYIKVDMRDELHAHILNAGACIKQHEDQLRRTTCDLHPQAAKYTDVGGGNFEYLF
jgi:hypothetical protein